MVVVQCLSHSQPFFARHASQLSFGGPYPFANLCGWWSTSCPVQWNNAISEFGGVVHASEWHVACSELVKLVKNSETGILLTSYDQLRLQRSELLAVNWGYAILDEGHKIRNPDAEVGGRALDETIKLKYTCTHLSHPQNLLVCNLLPCVS